MFAILLLNFNYTLEHRHRLFHNIIQCMELGSFVAIFSQDLIVVLSDVIEYHFMFYMGI